MAPDVQFELARVDRREKVLTEERNQDHAAQAEAEEDDGKEPVMRQRALQRLRVAHTEAVEGLLEFVLKAGEKAALLFLFLLFLVGELRLAVMDSLRVLVQRGGAVMEIGPLIDAAVLMDIAAGPLVRIGRVFRLVVMRFRLFVRVAVVAAAHQVHREGRHQRPGQDVRRHDREADRFGQRHEEVTGPRRRAGTSARRRCKYRGDDTKAGTAIWLAPLRMPSCSFSPRVRVIIDVFDRHRRVIHEDADGQGQARRGS